ncbi:hypothetical protein DICVIV_01855 [Dictyocaulus viviparus]|uniref:Uncharacterized protein n=1 Tax=Dictyocaulus viviparus TaxID=29172 RepID=A0A0D8Y7K2_DICVI|nr:hypothetical protein DICVIV_01855 [Dictyocaulus viviparus]
MVCSVQNTVSSLLRDCEILSTQVDKIEKCSKTCLYGGQLESSKINGDQIVPHGSKNENPVNGGIESFQGRTLEFKEFLGIEYSQNNNNNISCSCIVQQDKGYDCSLKKENRMTLIVPHCSEEKEENQRAPQIDRRFPQSNFTDPSEMNLHSTKIKRPHPQKQSFQMYLNDTSKSIIVNDLKMQ